MPRTGPNIYKRKDGRWEARYVKAIGPDGKKKYGSVYANSYRDAKEKQIQCSQNIHHLSHGNVNMSVEELMWAWLTSRINTIKRSTYLKYESVIRNHLSPGIGQTQIRYLSSQMIDRFADEKLHSKTPLSPKTVNDILAILGLALSFAEQEYGVPKPRICRVKEPHKEMRVLSIVEQQELETYLLQGMDSCKFGVLLALYTGLRIGELCALQWDDFKDGTIVINKSMHRIKSGGKTIIETTTPKSRSSIRVIPLPSFIMNFVEQFKSEGAVMKTSQGKLVEPRLMQFRFKKYTAECNLSNVSFHALRHTFATRCVEAGFDIKSLSEILGHTDVKTTLNRYVHSSFELKRCNMDKLHMSAIVGK